MLSNASTKTVGIETSQVEEPKKEENINVNNYDEEKQEKIKEKPVKIVTKADN